MSIQSRPLGGGWFEPESAANEENQPVYPYNKVTETESGHIFEMDDTPRRERVRLEHRSGTFIEMHPNGDEVHKVYGDGYEITIKDKNVLIQGHCSVTVEGDYVVNVEGSKIQRIKGDYDLYVEGNIRQVSEGRTTTLSKGNMKVGAGATLTGALGAGGGGGLDLYSGRNMVVNGDLNVSGKVLCDSLSATFSIDAILGGVSAGPQGFVSELGGLSVGPLYPIAIPGSVMASVQMAAPYANFLTMTSILMTDVVNTTIYSTHFHIAPKGVTSTPLFPMF
jgi:hypothetical protein